MTTLPSISLCSRARRMVHSEGRSCAEVMPQPHVTGNIVGGCNFLWKSSFRGTCQGARLLALATHPTGQFKAVFFARLGFRQRRGLPCCARSSRLRPLARLSLQPRHSLGRNTWFGVHYKLELVASFPCYCLDHLTAEDFRGSLRRIPKRRRYER